MPNIYGVDSSSDVKHGTGEIRQGGAIERKPVLDLATTLLRGAEIRFWGRYFKDAHNPDSIQYQSKIENPILRQHDIRLLPFARQTGNVGRGVDVGKHDAIKNVNALVESLGVSYLASVGKSFVMFLDTEPPGAGPRLGKDYYTGWSNELLEHSRSISENRFEIVPCVYLNQSDTGTCSGLKAAIDAGTRCDYICVARYFSHQAYGDHEPPTGFEAAKTKLPNKTLTDKVMLWQYVGDCYGPRNGAGDLDGPLDAIMANPSMNIETFLEQLALPPAT